MGDSVPVQLDPQAFLAAIKSVRTELDQLRAAFIAFAETPANKLKLQAAAMATSVASMVQTVDKDLGKVSGSVEKAMIKMADSAKKSGERAGKEFSKAWSDEMKRAAGAAKAAFNEGVKSAGPFSSLTSGKLFGQVSAPEVTRQLDLINAQIKSARERHLADERSMLSKLQAQAKAMWEGRAAAEKQGAAEYAARLDIINAQIKAARDAREQAQTTQLTRLKNQTRAMWDAQVQEEKAGAARLADALRKIKSASAALQMQISAYDRGEGNSIVKGKNFGAPIISTEQENALNKANAASLLAVRAAADQVSTAKQRAREEAEKLREEHSKSTEQARNLHSAFRGLAAAGNLLFITYGALLPLTTAFFAATSVRNAIETYKDLEYQLKFIQALSQDYTKTLAEMQAGVISTSMAMGVLPVEAAKGMRVLAQAGLSATDALRVLPTTLAVATVGELDMATAAETLTGAMHAFGGSLSSMSKIGDVFVKAAAVSNTSVASIAESMKQASSIAQEFKVSVEDVGTMLAALAKRNIVGSAGGTAIRNMFGELAAPRGEAKKVAAQLQLTLFDPLKHTVNNFFDTFLPDLRKKLEAFNPESQTYILHRMFNERGAKAMSALLGMTPQDLAELRASVTDSAGYAMKVFVEANNTIQGDLNKLKSAYSSAVANAGAAGAEPLRAALQGLTGVLKDEGVQSSLAGLIRLVGDLSLVMGNVAAFMLSPAGSIAALTALGLAGRAAATGLLTGASSAGAFTLAAAGVVPAAGAATTALTGFAAAAATLLRFTLITAAIAGTLLALSKLYDWVSKDTTSEMLQKQYNSAAKDAEAYNEKLREEIELLKRRNIEAAGGTYVSADINAAARRIEQAQKAVDDAKTRLATASSGRGMGGGLGSKSVVEREVQTAQKQLAEARADYNKALDTQRERAQLEERLAIDRGKAEMSANTSRLAAGTKSFDKTDPSKAYADDKKLLDLQLQSLNLRAQQEESFAKAQEDALKQSYDRGLVDYRTYQERLSQIQGEYLDKRLATQEEERKMIQQELDGLRSKAGPAGKTDKALANDIRAVELKLQAFDLKTVKMVQEDLAQRERATTDLLKPGAELLRNAEKQNALDELNAKQAVDKLKAHNNLLKLSERERFVAEETAKIFDRQEDHLQNLVNQKKELEKSGALDGEMPNEAALAQWIALNQEIDASIARMNDLKAKTAAELAQIFDAQKNREHLKKLANEYEALAKDINENLADAILDAGKDGGKSLVKFLQDELLRKPFKIFLMAELQGVSGFLAGLMKPEGMAASSALGTVGSYASAASNLGSLYGAASQLMFGGSAGASTASLGYANAVGAMGGDSIGALIQANGSWAGVSGAVAEGGSAVYASGAAEALAAEAELGAMAGSSGAGSMLSTLGPYALVAAFILKGASMMKGETRTGGQYGLSTDGESAYSYRRGKNYAADGVGAVFLEGPSGGVLKDDDGNDLGAALVNTTVGNINSLLKNLGTNISVQGFNAGYESSNSGRGGVFSGGQLSTGQWFGESGQGDNYKGTLFEQWTQNGLSTTALGSKEAFAAFGVDMQGVVIQALQAAANMAPRSVVTPKEQWQQSGEDGGWMAPYNEYSRVFDETQTELENLPKTIRDMIRGFDVEGASDKEVTELYTKINATVQGVVELTKVLEALPFNNLIKSSFDTKASLIELADSMDDVAGNGAATLGALMSTYVENFYSEEEKKLAIAKNISKTLGDNGVSMSAEEILASSREKFRALVTTTEASAATGDATAQKLLLTLYSVSGAFASIIPAAEAAADAVEDTAAQLEKLRDEAMEKAQKAYDALDRAVSKQVDSVQASLDAAEELISNLQGVFDLLQTNVRELYAQVDQPMSAAKGRAFISNALSTARATGYMPDVDDLGDAIAAARTDLVDENFVTRVDADRQRLLLAGQLSELKDMAGTQLTSAQLEAERYRAELERLDGILQTAKDQLDVLNGVDITLLDIATALQKFNDAVKAVPPKPGAAGSGGTASTGASAVFGPGPSASPAVDVSQAKYKRQTVAGLLPVFDPEEIKHLDEGWNLVQTFNGTGDVAGLFNAARESGLTMSDLQAITGYHYNDIVNAAASVGIPRFDVGTNYVPDDMLAVVHRGEAIVPAAYNPAFSGNDAVLAELRALRIAIERLHEDNSIENRAAVSNLGAITRTLDRVAPQGDAFQTREVPA